MASAVYTMDTGLWAERGGMRGSGCTHYTTLFTCISISGCALRHHCAQTPINVSTSSTKRPSVLVFFGDFPPRDAKLG